MAMVAQFGARLKALFGPGGKLSTPKKRLSVPASNFLVPSERKYPYRTPDGKVSRKLLIAAIKRAAQQGRTDVEAKARMMLRRLGESGE